MNKKTLIGAVVVIVVLIAGIWFLIGGGPGTPGADRTTEELEKLALPKVGEESPEEGVGVPGKIAEGESGNENQQYWVFETELKDGKLNPFELRVPVGDILGISILNSEDEEHVVSISGGSEFVPSFIERTIAPGGTESMITQTIVVGEYDILCGTCKNEVIGKFVVVPKK